MDMIKWIVLPIALAWVIYQVHAVSSERDNFLAKLIDALRSELVGGGDGNLTSLHTSVRALTVALIAADLGLTSKPREANPEPTDEHARWRRTAERSIVDHAIELLGLVEYRLRLSDLPWDERLPVIEREEAEFKHLVEESAKRVSANSRPRTP